MPGCDKMEREPYGQQDRGNHARHFTASPDDRAPRPAQAARRLNRLGRPEARRRAGRGAGAGSAHPATQAKQERVETLSTVVDYSEGGVAVAERVEVEETDVEVHPATMLIRVNYPIEQMTFGARGGQAARVRRARPMSSSPPCSAACRPTTSRKASSTGFPGSWGCTSSASGTSTTSDRNRLTTTVRTGSERTAQPGRRPDLSQ